jgi:hypothetical protein
VNLPQLTGFFANRWHGHVPLPVLFWRDMLLVGSCIHLAAGFVVLMLIAQGAALSLAITMHFLLLPYSLFLVMAVWRFPEGTMATKWVSALWLVLFTLV